MGGAGALCCQQDRPRWAREERDMNGRKKVTIRAEGGRGVWRISRNLALVGNWTDGQVVGEMMGQMVSAAEIATELLRRRMERKGDPRLRKQITVWSGGQELVLDEDVAHALYIPAGGAIHADHAWKAVAVQTAITVAVFHAACIEQKMYLPPLQLDTLIPDKDE